MRHEFVFVFVLVFVVVSVCVSVLVVCLHTCQDGTRKANQHKQAQLFIPPQRESHVPHHPWTTERERHGPRLIVRCVVRAKCGVHTADTSVKKGCQCRVPS